MTTPAHNELSKPRVQYGVLGRNTQDMASTLYLAKYCIFERNLLAKSFVKPDPIGRAYVPGH